jgi:transposase
LVRNRLTDAEWAIFDPFLTQQSAQGGRPPKDHRRTLDGIFWITRTGAPWRDLPEELGKWNSLPARPGTTVRCGECWPRARISCWAGRRRCW